ncbi:MAG: hypothetical protein K0S97_2623 [Chloroflexota bacterium]|jgi:hypothetical protein|nr:hypothetical protein [Chloroflexota bacterium]
MTSERDFDRIARAWLDLGPDEAPDRAVAAVLQAVETTPQVRRPWIRPSRRFPIMNRLPTLAAIAAALVIAVGGGAVLLGRPADDPAVGVPVSPSPSASPSGSVPTALRHVWLGETRDVAGIDTDRSFLGFTADEANYLDALASTVSMSAPDRLRLTLKAAGYGCEAGDIGTYAVQLSPGGTKLNLATIDEACPARRDAIAGDWLRSQCLNPENFCLGELEAGEYPSFFFAPRLAAGDEWAPDWGALRYTVPDGWAATSDFPREYFIEPADWYASSRHDFARETRGIYVASHIVPFEDTGGCGPRPAAALAAEAFARLIAEHPGLDAGEPQEITIGGRSGWMVDATADAGWSGVCSGAPTPVTLLFGEDGKNASDGRAWGAMVTEASRYIFLELADQTVVLIEIAATTDRFDVLLAEAMPIVESFVFE